MPNANLFRCVVCGHLYPEAQLEYDCDGELWCESCKDKACDEWERPADKAARLDLLKGQAELEGVEFTGQPPCRGCGFYRCRCIPDWARPMTPMELEREAMDYEFNAQFDRYDGWGDPDPSAQDDYLDYHPDGRPLYWPTLPTLPTPDSGWDNVPF